MAPPLLVAALAVAMGATPLVGWTPLVVLVVVYASILAIAAVVADARRWLLVVVALVTMHLAWGTGFLLGGWAARRT